MNEIKGYAIVNSDADLSKAMHSGSVILKIEEDSVGTIDVQRFFIKDINHKIHKLTIRPEIGQFYAVKDTLR